MIYFFSQAMIIIYAVLYGITMKIADLLDEHGLKWFKGSDILMGISWGIFGTLLVLSNNVLANIILAMNLAFIVRRRLDYINHAIASSMIIIVFLLTSKINAEILLSFYAIFLIFGSLRDYAGDKKKKNTADKIYDNFMWYYPLPALAYSIIYSEWIVFLVFLAYTVGYDLTKYIYRQKGYP